MYNCDVILLQTFLIFALSLASVSAWAYPNSIRLGYIDCNSCHVSTLGGAQLTDYGKAFADANAFFSRAENEDEDHLNDESPSSLLSRLNASVFGRYLFLDQGGIRDSFLMQADGMLTAQVNPRAVASIAIGWVPEVVQNSPSAPSGILGKSFLLRKATFQYSFDDIQKTRVVMGREHLPMAIRMDDHTTFIRLYSRQGVTDYPTQVRYEKTASDRQWMVGGYLPSFEESLKNREAGLFARDEWRLSKMTSVVALGLFGKGVSPSGVHSVDQRLHADVGVRHAFTSQVGVLASIQGARRMIQGTQAQQGSFYSRAFYFPKDWVEIGYVGEKLAIGTPYFSQRLVHGPDLYFRVVKEMTFVAQWKWMDAFGGGMVQNLFTLQAFGRI
ncbi:MAG: hypothetical protein JNL01_12460 [Bdellovibrionales bacterium]|nr:hypothetical protein [Bdellovibrionales bacterium]